MKKQGWFYFTLCLVCVYCLYFGSIVFLKFRCFAYNDFDLAVHALSSYNLTQGALHNSILGIPFLGNHMHLILFFVAPAYALFRHPLTLLFLQTAALGCAAIPLYRFSAHLLDEKWAAVIGMLYLFYPAVGYINLYEFHPVALAVFFIFMALYYYEIGALKKYLLWMFFALLCKENVALLFIMLGIGAGIRRKDKRWAGWTLGIALPYLAGALLLMRAYNRDTIHYLLLYNHLGNSLPEIAGNLIADPALLWGMIARREVLVYLFSLCAPLAFVPCIAFAHFSLAAPFLAQHILSNRPTDLMIVYHYTALIIPIIFVAFVHGLKRVLRRATDRRFGGILKGLFVAGILVSNMVMGPQLRLAPSFLSAYRMDSHDRYKEAYVQALPRRASVVATFEFLSHVTQRRRLYSFHHLCKGTYTLSKKAYPVPEEIDYALIDFNDQFTFRGFCRGQAYLNTQRFLIGRPWQVLDFIDSLAFLQSGVSEEGFLCDKIPPQEAVSVAEEKPIIIDDAFVFLGIDSSQEEREADVVAVTLYWECLQATGKDLEIIFHVVDAADTILLQKRIPLCYRMFPSFSWRPGERYRQRIRLAIPDEYRDKEYVLHMSFINVCSTRYVPIEGSRYDKSIVLNGVL